MNTVTVTVLEVAQMLRLAPRGPVVPDMGRCWSCDAEGSKGFVCRSGHQFNACDETCGHPKLDADGFVDWESCHECQQEIEASAPKGCPNCGVDGPSHRRCEP